MEYPFKDLLPLDEVLEREGYYKDWTHLDPEVFYSLTQISEYIKTKGYGVDVRLLIAQLAEHFGLKTTQVVDLGNLIQAEHATLKQQVQQAVAQVNADRNALETQFNQSVAQMEADKDAVIANATVDSEVILARGGKATLGQRLDDTTAQLAQIVYQKHPIVAKLLEEPTIMAHRALYKVFPENTLSAFYACYKAGITFFETDFRKTIDGYWVCHHDASTLRLTGVDLDVANSTLADIKNLNVVNGANSSLYGDPKIPTIDEVFKFIKKTKSIVNINFDYGIATEDIPIIVDKIYAYGIQNNVICQGQAWHDVDNTLCISNGGYIGTSEERFKEAQRKGNMISSYNFGYVGDVDSTENIMQLASKYSVPVNIYTVENYSNFRSLDTTSVNCMMVDYLWFRNGAV